MKIVRYEHRGTVGYGVWREGRIHPVEGELFGSFSETGESLPEGDVRLLSPLVPNKLIAIGLNYREHAREQGKPLPEEPLMFMVSPTAVVGPGEAIRLPNLEDRIDHEAELAIVIGKRGKNIPREKAEEYIFGYTCANDVSNRVLQARDGQNTRAKSFDTFKPLGPAIATEIDPSDLPVRCRVNGNPAGRSHIGSDPSRSCAVGVHFLCLSSGTRRRHFDRDAEAVWDRSARGTKSEVTIEGIGTLSNRVVAP